MFDISFEEGKKEGFAGGIQYQKADKKDDYSNIFKDLFKK
jgi:hypothetical protein